MKLKTYTFYNPEEPKKFQECQAEYSFKNLYDLIQHHILFFFWDGRNINRRRWNFGKATKYLITIEKEV